MTDHYYRDEYVTLCHDCARIGWTFWSSRSLRTYCPDCGPSRGHHMTDITESIARRRV